jgi:hypothetical protein
VMVVVCARAHGGGGGVWVGWGGGGVNDKWMPTLTKWFSFASNPTTVCSEHHNTSAVLTITRLTLLHEHSSNKTFNKTYVVPSSP